ncbi:DMT family transporter [Planctobacterium marinum]|uniref:DMT family transporter n=1 Tax=Planctobacterium marinum TaxID=1631968 RepID=UPI001E331A88|nr:DMT family transporter [Planctobacterium marinum]MCC2606379.1 DMT family transporter [Planctobacterium marinum]
MQKNYSLVTGYIMAAIVISIWSGFIVVSRYGATNALLNYDLIALRYGVATLVSIPVWWFFSARINFFHYRYLLLALFGGLCYAFCAFSAFALAPANHAAVFLPGFMPVAISLCIWLILGTRVQGKQLIALGIISAGIVLLALNTLTVSADTLRGDLLFMGAAFSWGVFNALLKKWHPDPYATVAAVSLFTSVVYLPLFLMYLPSNLGSAPDAEIWLQAGYQGVLAAVVQLLLYVKAAKTIGANNMAVTMAFVPVLAALLAVPVLQEQITVFIAVSLLCVTGGAIYGNIHGNKNRHKDEIN